MKAKEIKFKAIPTKAKKYDFIEGDLIKTDEERYFIFPEGFELAITNLIKGIAVYSGFGLLIEVQPETICTFTGFYDAEGKPIYEGDLVKLVSTNLKEEFKLIYEIQFSKYDGWVRVSEGLPPEPAFKKVDPSRDYIVIGNRKLDMLKNQ